MPRQQLCTLSYSDLEVLSLRLSEAAETVSNQLVRAYLQQAALAVSDLATLRFAIEEIAANCDAVTALKLRELMGREARR